VHLEIDRSDIRRHRMVDTSTPAPADGEVVLSLSSFALTSNNISYAHSGDFLDYWGFFPTEAGWGRLPAMGHGIVTASAHPDIEVGGRYFGFFPVCDQHVVRAEVTRGGFVDVAPHREKHAMAYRSFDKVSPVEGENDHAILVLRGLFVTSFLVEDFLFDNGVFGAGQILVSSASSKTSIALAHRIRARGNTHCIGLTSADNVDFVNRVNLYDEVVTYDQIDSLADWAPTVFVDMAGNASVISGVHHHFGDALMHSCRIGATHWDQTGSLDGIPGPTPAFFFAPSQLAKRGREWGREVLNERMDSALTDFIVDSRRWLRIETSYGPDAVSAVYDQLVSGRVNPETGHILSL
jgi:NADPH:quinone reductase-like Zn-dependent oxidoreductase